MPTGPVARREPRSLADSDVTSSFLIVRLGALGDIVHAIPVVAALREAYPGARIGWIVHPRFAPLLHLVEGLDHVYPLERRSGAQAIRDVRRDRYEVCLDLQGLIKSAAVARFSGARRVIGFSRPLLRESAAALAYTESGGEGAGHVIDKNLSLLALVGVHTRARRFPLRIPETPVVPCTREILGARPRCAVRADQSRRGMAEQALAGGALRRGRARSCGSVRGCAARCSGDLTRRPWRRPSRARRETPHAWRRRRRWWRCWRWRGRPA